MPSKFLFPQFLIQNWGKLLATVDLLYGQLVNYVSSLFLHFRCTWLSSTRLPAVKLRRSTSSSHLQCFLTVIPTFTQPFLSHLITRKTLIFFKGLHLFWYEILDLTEKKSSHRDSYLAPKMKSAFGCPAYFSQAWILSAGFLKLLKFNIHLWPHLRLAKHYWVLGSSPPLTLAVLQVQGIDWWWGEESRIIVRWFWAIFQPSWGNWWPRWQETRGLGWYTKVSNASF